MVRMNARIFNGMNTITNNVPRSRRLPHLLWGLALLLVLIVGLCGRADAGSPFYLTVERGYSTGERPEVRLDFTKQSEPMVLRVLRPKDLEGFLAGQLNISRAYEEPLSEINPGNYIFRGLNQLEAPLGPLRSLLSTDFRSRFRSPALGKALREPVQGDLVHVPREVTIGGPAGFEVAREVFLDLQTGGETPEASNWFWQPSEGEDSSYKVRTIELDPLPDGVYLLQAVQGKIEAQALLQVSSLSVQVKQSSAQLLVRVMDRALQPVSNCAVSYRDGRGKWQTLPNKSGPMGEVLFDNPEGIFDGKLLVRVATADGRLALTQTDFLPASTVENSVYLVTDRPIFKPGEQFFFKGIVRLLENGSLRVPKITKPEAKISLFRTDGTPVDQSIRVPVTDFGTFSGTLALGATQPPGLYRVVADLDGKPYGGEFRVKDYVKPKFYLELTNRDAVLRPGEKFAFDVRAKTYSGLLPKDVHYEVFVYRRRFEVPQFVVESGNGLQAGEDYFGNVRTATSLAQPQRIYSSVEARAPGSGADINSSWATAPALDEKGEAHVELDIPAGTAGDEKIEWTYTVMVRAQDQAGLFAVASDTIHATLSNVVLAAKFREPVVPLSEAKASFVVRATSPDGEPLNGVTGQVQVKLDDLTGSHPQSEVPFTTSDGGFATVALPIPKTPGVMNAVAAVRSFDGKALSTPSLSEAAKLVVGGADGSAVIANRDLQVFASSTLLSPGEKAKVLVLMPETWGENNSGTVWQTAAGTKVYGTRADHVTGRSRWLEVEAKPEYGTGFYETVTVPTGHGTYSEQSVGFRVVPTEKRLSIAVRPSAEVAEPMRDFPLALEVRDSAGKPAANVELSVDVVDRSVYAVQPEFRPDVMEFFYPLPRLNLANFYSDELQGYGYADEIRRPNFRLAALKNRAKPAKRSMRDTAGWFPHVVTDQNGRATVTVPMPANITEWLVTAIGADKQGRVGEGHGRFRSASDISTEAIVPQFLREGDVVQGSVRLENHLDRAITVHASPEATGGLLATSVSVPTADGGVAIGAKSAVAVPVRIQAEQNGTEQKGEGSSGAPGLLRVRVDAESGVRAGGADEFDVPISGRSVEQTFDSPVLRADAPLQLAIPPEATVRRIRVQVTPGLLGASLAAARNLSTYPYGCTEQLVHTTIPNLVVLDLIKKANIPADKLAGFELEGTVRQAKERAELGIQKLLAHQKPDGGFVLWGSEPDASVPLTAMVTRALTLAVQLEVPGAMAAREKAVGFLAAQTGSWSYREGNTLDGYTLALLADAHLISALKDQYVGFVDAVAGDANAHAMSIVSALRILQHLKGQWWLTPEMHVEEHTEVLLTRLAAQMGAKDRFPMLRSVSEDFSELGFSPGEVAFVANALGVLKSYGRLTPAMQSDGIQLLRTRMQEGIWYSTFETGEVILNLSELLQDEIQKLGQDVAAGRQVSLVRGAADRGGETTALTPFPGGWYGEWDVSGSPTGAISGARLTGLSAEDRAQVHVTADVPYAAVKSSGKDVRVARRLLRISAKGSYELYKGEPLHVGDVVVSELSIERGEPGRWISPPSSYLVVEDSLPAVAQGVEEDAPYLADAKLVSDPDAYRVVVRDTQRYPDKTVRIVDLRPGAATKLYNVWRVAFAGHAALAPARAFDMYQPSSVGMTGAAEIEAQ